jgi:hypothetical protein
VLTFNPERPRYTRFGRHFEGVRQCRSHDESD